MKIAAEAKDTATKDMDKDKDNKDKDEAHEEGPPKKKQKLTEF